MLTKKDITIGKSCSVFIFSQPPILKRRPEIGNYRMMVKEVRKYLWLHLA